MKTDNEEIPSSYCPACGGSDRSGFRWPPFTGQVVYGHRPGCPVGDVGTPVLREHDRPTQELDTNRLVGWPYMGFPEDDEDDEDDDSDVVGQQ